MLQCYQFFLKKKQQCFGVIWPYTVFFFNIEWLLLILRSGHISLVFVLQDLAVRNQLYVEEMLWVCCRDYSVETHPTAMSDSETSINLQASHRLYAELYIC